MGSGHFLRPTELPDLRDVTQTDVGTYFTKSSWLHNLRSHNQWVLDLFSDQQDSKNLETRYDMTCEHRLQNRNGFTFNKHTINSFCTSSQSRRTAKLSRRDTICCVNYVHRIVIILQCMVSQSMGSGPFLKTM